MTSKQELNGDSASRRDAPRSDLAAAQSCSRSRLIELIAHHASMRASAVAIGEIGAEGELARSCTYAELAALSSRRADIVAASTEPGDVILGIMPSGIDFVVLFCAAISAGVKLLPMHTQVAGAEAVASADRAGAKLAVLSDDVSAALSLQHIEALTFPHHPGAESAGTCPLRRLRNQPGAIILGSSGTTGLPKLALRESPALDADAANVIAGMSLSPADCVLVTTPLSHSYGVDLLVATLSAGAAMHVASQFDPHVIAKQMRQSATILPGVPFTFEALARVPPSGTTRLRLALSAGSSLPDRVAREFQGAWRMPVGQLYGATELGTVSMDIPGSPGFDPASVGMPLDGVEMCVVDPDDPSRLVPRGQEGHLAVRAPSMLSRYLDGDVPQVDNRFLTGDLARIGFDGRVYITGRLKLLIDIGAYKVNPLEVEAELARHPGVAECVVVPLAASDTVQRLRAVYVPSNPEIPPCADELRRFLRGRLSANKVPRVFEIVPALPRSPAGKIRRNRV